MKKNLKSLLSGSLFGATYFLGLLFLAWLFAPDYTQRLWTSIESQAATLLLVGWISGTISIMMVAPKLTTTIFERTESWVKNLFLYILENLLVSGMALLCFHLLTKYAFHYHLSNVIFLWLPFFLVTCVAVSSARGYKKFKE
jgi:hypothetical protein